MTPEPQPTRRAERDRSGVLSAVVAGVGIAAVVVWASWQFGSLHADVNDLQNAKAAESSRADTATDAADTLDDQLEECAQLIEEGHTRKALLRKCTEPRVDADKLPDQGEVQDPELDDAEVQDPELQNAELQDPEVQNPERQESDPDDPDPDDPENQDPDSDDPEVDDPDVNDPEFDDPEQQDPEIDDPEQQDPEIDDPDPNDQPVSPYPFTFTFEFMGTTWTCTIDGPSDNICTPA